MEIWEFIKNNFQTITLIAVGAGGFYQFIVKRFFEIKFSGFKKKELKANTEIIEADAELKKIETISKYKEWLDGEMNSLMDRYTEMQAKVSIEHTKLAKMIKSRDAWIKLNSKKLTDNKIPFKPFSDEEQF